MFFGFRIQQTSDISRSTYCGEVSFDKISETVITYKLRYICRDNTTTQKPNAPMGKT